MAGREVADEAHHRGTAKQQQQRPGLFSRIFSLKSRKRQRQVDKGLEVAKRRSALISGQLCEDFRRRRKEPRVLCLGVGQSGYRTFILNCKSLFGGPDITEGTEDQRSAWKVEVQSFLVRGVRQVLEEMTGEGLLMSEPSSYDHSKIIVSQPDQVEQITDEVRQALLSLRSDAKLRRYARISSAQYAYPSLGYFFRHAERILDPGYVPTGADNFAARMSRSGFLETFVYFDKSRMSLIEFGGCRGERRKWIHLFEMQMDAIIVTVDIATCDEVLCEDGTVSRMKGDLVNFDSIIGSRWFRDSPIILLFTGAATLAEHPPSTSRLRQLFPDYTGSSNEEVIAYFRDRFLEMAQDQKREVHYFCCDVFESESCVREILEEVKALNDEKTKQYL